MRALASVWVERLREAGMAAYEKVTVAELMADPLVRERSLSITQHVEEAGDGHSNHDDPPVKQVVHITKGYAETLAPISIKSC